MDAFSRKDLLIIWRDRKEMLLAFVMPLILILVLSFALPDWVENRTGALDMSIALVVEEDQVEEVTQFGEELIQRGFTKESMEELMKEARQLNPVSRLQELLRHQEVSSFIQTLEVDKAAALQKLEAGEIEAIVTAPKGYTRAVLNRILLQQQGEVPPLEITAQEVSIKVQVLEDVLGGMMDRYNLQAAIGAALEEEGLDAPFTNMDKEPEVKAEREIMSGFQSVTSHQYYTMGIGILFSLFLASSMAMKAAAEKREFVFERIVLAGGRPVRYLLAKIMSTFFIVLLQVVFVVTVCQLALQSFPDRSIGFWLGFGALFISYSFCVAGLAALYTSLVFRLQEASANGLVMLFVIVMGTIGGGFVPIYVLPDWLRRLGEWTPNGMSLSAYLNWVQQGSFELILGPILYLILYAFLFIGISIGMFPRRRSS